MVTNNLNISHCAAVPVHLDPMWVMLPDFSSVSYTIAFSQIIECKTESCWGGCWLPVLSEADPDPWAYRRGCSPKQQVCSLSIKKNPIKRNWNPSNSCRAPFWQKEHVLDSASSHSTHQHVCLTIQLLLAHLRWRNSRTWPHFPPTKVQKKHWGRRANTKKTFPFLIWVHFPRWICLNWLLYKVFWDFLHTSVGLQRWQARQLAGKQTGCLCVSFCTRNQSLSMSKQKHKLARLWQQKVQWLVWLKTLSPLLQGWLMINPCDSAAMTETVMPLCKQATCNTARKGSTGPLAGHVRADWIDGVSCLMSDWTGSAYRLTGTQARPLSRGWWGSSEETFSSRGRGGVFFSQKGHPQSAAANVNHNLEPNGDTGTWLFRFEQYTLQKWPVVATASSFDFKQSNAKINI